MKIVLLGVQLASLVNFRGPLIRDLVAAGHEVVAVAPEPTEPWLGRLQALGARYVEAPMARLGLNPLRDLSFFFWLARLFRAEQPDILFAFQAKAVIYGMPAARLAGVQRRVAMIEGLGQGFATDWGGLRHRLVRFLVPKLYRLGLQSANLVMFLNEEDRADFRAYGIIRGQKTLRIPGIGVDLDHFVAQPLPQGPVTFLMMARLIEAKGVRDYVAAAQRVRREHPEARFVLLGQPDYSHSGVPVADLLASGAVEYMGETGDVRPYLKDCHVVVLPTAYREGMPRSILEAMATGRPILTTTMPGARETVVESVNGHLVEPRNHEALAAVMLGLIRAPERLGPMGQASRRLAEERYDVRQINRQIMAALAGE